MGEGCLQRVLEFVGLVDPDAEQPGAGNLGEVGVVELSAVGDDPGCFHLQFHERQRAVVEEQRDCPAVRRDGWRRAGPQHRIVKV